jgi:hypothetical protein
MHGFVDTVVLSLVIAVVVVVMTVGTAWLFKQGGAPTVRGGAVYYGLRPAVRVTALVLGGLGVWATVTGVRGLARPRDLMWMLELFGGLAMVAGASFAWLAGITLDAEGVHVRRGWKRAASIAWNDLDHYEISFNTKTGTSMVFLRSNDGRTIPVEEGAYDVADMLRRIQGYRAVEEQPYKERHWYGG